MARAIDANELEMFPYSEGAGTEEQIADWIEQAGLSEDDTASRARDLCWKVIEGFVNVVKTQPTLTPPNTYRDLISRSALLRGETEPEIITGSDSELAEHMEWERWMDKIKRAPAVDKEEEP